MTDTNITPAMLRDAYQDQIRARLSLDDPEHETVDADGPLRRRTTTGRPGFITYRDLAGLDGAELDALIARQCAHFDALGIPVEWKYHGWDEPADLPQRLVAAGFEPEDPEALVIGEAAEVAIAPRLPDGIELRRITERHDLERLAALEDRVWDAPGEHQWIPENFPARMASTTDPLGVVVAEADGEMISGAWMKLHIGTSFVSLWGGSTLEEWRGRGVYRAVVARRAQLALAQGFRFVQVDCSPDSRPILTRLGLHDVGVTTPYVRAPRG